MNRLSVLMLLPAVFVACGDSDGIIFPSPSANYNVGAMEDLPNCTETREGETALVTEDSSTYVCRNGKWVFVSAPMPTAATLDDLSNCTTRAEGDTVMVESESAIFRCHDGEWLEYRTLMDTLTSLEDLLVCVSKREGKSAYISAEHALYVCEDGTWEKRVSYMDSVATKNALPNCTAKNADDSSFVKGENAVYLCIAESWRYLGDAVAVEDDLPNCTEKRDGERAFVAGEHVTLVCSENKWYRYDIYKSVEEMATAKSSSSAQRGDKWDDYAPSSSSVASSSSKMQQSSSTVSSSSVLKSSSSSANSSSSKPVSSSSSAVTSSSSTNSSSSEPVSSSSSAVTSSSSTKILLQNDIIWANATYIVDPRDNEKYRIVNIKNQTWMAENLRYKGYTTGKSYCYAGIEENCSIYGRLYTWAAVMAGSTIEGAQGICPANWHVPTADEWEVLRSSVSGNRTAIEDYSWNGGVDTYGFSVKISGQYVEQETEYNPAGFSNGWDASYERGYSAPFWTSTVSSGGMAIHSYIYESFNGGDGSWDEAALDKNTAIGLRCISNVPLSFDRQTPKKHVARSSVAYYSDGKGYNTVQIGPQIWMSEDVSGTYTWTEAMGISSKYQEASANGVVSSKQQGVCPDGFHIPHNSEWFFLRNYVDATNGSESVAASLMVENEWPSKDNATDSYGFSAYPVGSESSGFDGDLYGSGKAVYFWSATEDYDESHAHYFALETGGTDLRMKYNNYNKRLSFSVRCIKDDWLLGTND